jgi:cell division control protein 6
MNLFKDMLSADESLFINPDALDYDYLPKLLPYREDQQFYLASCIKPLFQGRTASNILITGKPGIGKTAAAKFVLREMENETDKIVSIYINCWKKDTPHKIVLEICQQIGYKWIQNKKTDELMKSVAELINKKAAVFIFDEVDKLDSEQIIYQLLEDIYKKCIILITNEKDWLVKLDNRVKSRLIPDLIEFHPYNAVETEGIMKQRIDYAFVPNVWQEGVLDILTEKAVVVEDIRVGMFLLRETGQIAENKGSRKILKEHAEEAISKLANFQVLNSKDLTEEDNDIINMIRKNAGESISVMYEVYNKKYDKTYRTFQRKVRGLEDAGLISVTEDHSKKGGKISRLDVVRK